MKKLLTAAVAAAALSAPMAMAYEAGDIILRAGLAHVNPNDDARGTLDTLNAEVGSETQLGLTGVYMLNENVGVELLAATPFTHTIKNSATGAKLGDTKQLPPTLSVQYYPMGAGSKVQPYVGAGINYTVFFSEDSDLGDLKLENSVGLSVQAGIDYQINDKFLVNAAVWYIDIDTDAKLGSTDIGGVDIDPWVYMVGLGYKF